MLDVAPIRILVVDDDRDTCALIADCLDPEYEVVTAFAPRQALELCLRQRFHLALVDVRMPGISGLKLVPHLSDLAPQMGIVMITSYAAVPDAVAALRDLDALDYVQKPFSPAKLRQRIREALRRLDQAQWLALGDLTIHVQGHVVERDGKPLPLTRQEFKMLLAIARGRGRLVGYEELVGEVWECKPHSGQREFVRNAMSRLRGKLGDDAADPRYIETVRGMGYRTVGSHK